MRPEPARRTTSSSDMGLDIPNYRPVRSIFSAGARKMRGVTVVAHSLGATQPRPVARPADASRRKSAACSAKSRRDEFTRRRAPFGVKPLEVQTPLESARGSTEREIVLVPVLARRLGMLDSILQLIPHALVGFIGLKREETTLRAVF